MNTFEALRSFKVGKEVWFFTQQNWDRFSDAILDGIPAINLRFLADVIKPFVEGTWYL